jgi:hypothetical protein
VRFVVPPEPDIAPITSGLITKSRQVATARMCRTTTLTAANAQVANLPHAGNGGQGATASPASTATPALWNLQLAESKRGARVRIPLSPSSAPARDKFRRPTAGWLRFRDEVAPEAARQHPPRRRTNPTLSARRLIPPKRATFRAFFEF